MKYASFPLRALAFAIDYVLILGYLVVLIVAGVAASRSSPTLARDLFANPASAQLTGFLAVTLPVSLYFALLESSRWQASLGKRRLGLRVARAGGARLSRARALGRTLLKFVPWELAHTCIWQTRFAPQAASPLILAGFIVVWLLVLANVLSLAVSKTRQTLYDRLIGSYVTAV